MLTALEEAERFGAVEVVRAHGEDKLRIAHELLRQGVRPMIAKIETVLERHEQGAIRRR